MDDEQRRQIFRLAGEGMSNRAIGRVVGLSHPSVAAVLAAPPPPPIGLPAPPRALAPPDPDSAAPPDDAGALAQIRFLLAEARSELRRAQAAGDAQLVQKQTRNAGFLANALGRLERQQTPDGSITISAADFAAAEADLDLKARAYAERGGQIRCADCNRALSVKFGLGEIDEPATEAADA